MKANKFYTYIFTWIIIGMGTMPVQAQDPADSLIINVGQSKLIFLVNDPQDLNTLQDYDLNAMVQELSQRVRKDTIITPEYAHAPSVKTYQNETDTLTNSDNTPDSDTSKQKWRKRKRTYSALNFDIGTNNYLGPNGSFPDEDDQPYAVRPWGSWHVAINSTFQTHVSGPLFLDWGGGISWYNFKFQNDNIVINQPAEELVFEPDTAPERDYKKSKLTASYLNIMAVPVLRFGEYHRHYGKFWNRHKDHLSGFRIGAGAYAGYRLGSHSKIVYKESGDKEKDKNRDNFNLTNIRYGLRFQLGFGGTDLFFNYDLNELFNGTRGPTLNAFSFGITL